MKIAGRNFKRDALTLGFDDENAERCRERVVRVRSFLPLLCFAVGAAPSETVE